MSSASPSVSYTQQVFSVTTHLSFVSGTTNVVIETLGIGLSHNSSGSPHKRPKLTIDQATSVSHKDEYDEKGGVDDKLALCVPG